MDAGNNVAVFESQLLGDAEQVEAMVAAVDLSTGQLLWNQTIPATALGSNSYEMPTVGAGNGTVAIQSGTQIQMVDAVSGTVTASGTLTAGGFQEFVGNDFLTTDGITVTAHPIADPNATLWQANELPSVGPALQSDAWTVFGGHWRNTNDGVIDAVTGQPAPFGRDAHISSDGSQYVYYDGQSDTDVLRHFCDQTSCGVQIWDTASNTAKALVISNDQYNQGAYACTDGSSDTIVTMALQSGPPMLTGYSLQTGRMLWQAQWPAPTSSDNTRYCGSFAGNTYVVQDSVSYSGVIALDVATGLPVWSSTTNYTVTANSGTAYLQFATFIDAYDGNNGFTPLWTIGSPAAGVQLQSVGGHLFATGASTGQAWVLSGM